MLRSLQRRLQAKKKRRHNRRVSFADLITDRWENARQYGFGSGVSMYDNVLVIGNVTVGDNTWIGPNVILDGSGGSLAIGKNCTICAGAQVYTHDSVKWALSGGDKPYDQAPTSIGDHCFVGPNAVIAKGVVIGDRVAIGACCFVNKSVPSDGKFTGRP